MLSGVLVKVRFLVPLFLFRNDFSKGNVDLPLSLLVLYLARCLSLGEVATYLYRLMLASKCNANAQEEDMGSVRVGWPLLGTCKYLSSTFLFPLMF